MQGTGNVTSVGKAVGRRVRVVECAGKSIDVVLTNVAGTGKTGGWLIVKGSFGCFDGAQISELAIAMRSVMEAARHQTASFTTAQPRGPGIKGAGMRPFERPGMFLWGSSQSDFDVSELPPQLRCRLTHPHTKGTERHAA